MYKPKFRSFLTVKLSSKMGDPQSLAISRNLSTVLGVFNKAGTQVLSIFCKQSPPRRLSTYLFLLLLKYCHIFHQQKFFACGECARREASYFIWLTTKGFL